MKDLLYLGLALLCFYVVLVVMAGLLSLVVGGLPDLVVALVVTALSFLAGAKLYHWLAQEGRGWDGVAVALGVE
jgi:hypothetical protein